MILNHFLKLYLNLFLNPFCLPIQLSAIALVTICMCILSGSGLGSHYSLAITYSRSQVIDFTIQFFNDEPPLMIPYPELDGKINGITRPFQFEVTCLNMF